MTAANGALWLLALAGTGCLDSLGPELGPEIPACVPADSNPAVAISFRSDVLEGVLTRACFKCHSPTSPNPIGITMGGLELTSYTTLRAGGVNSGAAIVIDGDSCGSILSQKLGESPPFGARMPRGGPYLDLAEQQTIADWIVEGALDN